MVPVLEKLGKNNSSRQWFFLWEPPWVLTFYERVIVLNREEIRAFALGRFLEGPKNSLEDEIETWDLEGPPVDESPHWVGAAYLEKNLHSTLGLLTAIQDQRAEMEQSRKQYAFSNSIVTDYWRHWNRFFIPWKVPGLSRSVIIRTVSA